MNNVNKNKHLLLILLFLCLFFTGISGTICAQDTIPERASADSIISVNDSIYPFFEYNVITNDSVEATPGSAFFQYDSVFSIFSDSTITIISENAETVIAKNESSFKPVPKIAFQVALIFPGFGQLYNRQYWKLPIVYGGLMACAYAITWNNKTFKDYNEAYYDIKYDSEHFPNPEDKEMWSNSWQSFVASSNNPAARLNDRTFHDNLRRKKDYFRRYRDLSIIIGVVVYFICAADSYVDAQMFDFDVSPDLSLRVTPEFRPETITNSRSFGFNLSMTF